MIVINYPGRFSTILDVQNDSYVLFLININKL